MSNLQQILELSSSWHKHLCPRQVLGARLALAGAAALGLAIPRRDKRLLLIAETDGCFTSGLEAATGCSTRHRTLRVVDYGKIGVTFVDVKTGTAVRLAPQLDIRQKAYQYAPEEKKRYYAQLIGYQRMPDDELLTVQPVQLTTPVSILVSRAGVRVNCARCGEEIINEREIVIEGRPLCAACAAPAYYAPQELLFVAALTADR
jgi:formylmethanofuran dehydrogenase subunit E